ncbi:LysM peptidoglycan-binding domain-containing protein [Georgenia thermotolerans]|uniref:LysM peptidoglycan-binding domain-containing protein n=1 Tax=Georgenia thermotolerans TaxID=527326 RepID=A0A7J5UNH3_9MICO|nr:LysM domain-containing protein [Georgenia thermotolerans]KAE8763935.1 hypothetical protein GB883_11540 [Georgenia thermotolerans]
MRPHTRAGVTLTVLAGAGLLAAGLGQRAREIALPLLDEGRVSQLTAVHLPDVVTLALLAAGCVVAVWYAATAAIALAALVLRGGPRHRLEGLLRRCGAPILRRVLLTTAATGVGVAVSLGGAAAATVEPDPALPVDLGWGAADDVSAPAPARAPDPSPPPVPPASSVPPSSAPSEDPGSRAGTPAATAPGTHSPMPGTPDSPTPHAPGLPTAGPPESPTPAAPGARPSPAPPSVAPSPPAPAAPTDRHVVTAGESLWAIAADHLPDSATDAEIAAVWPRWYRANAAVIGGDPDLIQPGQLLQAPTKESS